MIQIRYNITAGDHLEMLKAVRYTTSRQLVRLSLCAIGVLIAWLAYRSLGDNWLVLVFFFLALLIFQLAIPWIVHWRVYSRNPRLFGLRTTTFDENGITTDSEIHHVETKWSSFERFKETKNLFLIFQTRDVAGIVPKRAFAGESDAQQFRALVASKLPLDAQK